MKKYLHFLSFFLVAVMALLCFMGCTFDPELNDGTNDNASEVPENAGAADKEDEKNEEGQPETTDPDSSKPEDDDSEETKPGYPLPDHLRLPEGVEPAENEIIYQIPVTSPKDTAGYIRLVFADASCEQLKEIHLHYDVENGEQKDMCIARVSGGDVMIVSYYLQGPGVRTQQPTVMVFCEYEVETEDEGTVLMGISSVYQFFREESVHAGTAGWQQYYRIIDTQSARKPSSGYKGDRLSVMHSYKDHYEDEFGKSYESETGETMPWYHFDLIYSNIDGEEVMLQKNMTEFIEFPWTRLKTAEE